MSKYNASNRESHRQEFREHNNVYKFNSNNNNPLYTIDTPPPTVSWNLHIWHIFSYTQAEIIARYKRMSGYNVFYPIGFDDNGIPTEILVQKELWDQVKEMNRTDFREACLDITKKYREEYKQLWETLGMSFDREMSYSTISPFVQKIVQSRFIELYKKWVIVRKEFPALRDRANQTTIAQAETEEIEKESFFTEIRFNLVQWGEIIIATTRPELLTACVAVFVHPEDRKYRNYIWKTARTPFWQEVPILSDEKVKMDKWTWAVMCCSYGDETDIYWINKHHLRPRIIVTKTGRIENSGISDLDGLKTHQARKAIIPILEEKWVIVNHAPIKQGILYSERGKVPVEIIPVTQRFIDVTSIKQELIQYGEAMNFIPSHMRKRYNDWIENLERDRNISRSRDFGIPIPVWYHKTTNEIILPQESINLPIDPLIHTPDWYTKDQLIPETMVLDTRFTSGLTPDINGLLMEKTWAIAPDIFSLRPQAHDIIRTRLLYTTVQSHYKKNKKPFETIMISGHVLAKKGEKISKSKWNALFWPKELIEQYSADAVRYWSASGQLGKDIAFDETELKNWWKLVTKLRNVCQFLKIHLQKQPEEKLFEELYASDQRLLTRLYETIEKVTTAYKNYEVWLAKIAFEEFFWTDFSDNYLELIKNRLYKPETIENGEQLKQSAQYTLYHSLRAILRLIAPIMPHITEELYQDIFKEHITTKSIHLTEMPLSHKTTPIELDDILRIVSDVRWYKTKHQLSLWAEITLLQISGSQELIDKCKLYEVDLLWVTKADQITYNTTNNYDIDITQ